MAEQSTRRTGVPSGVRVVKTSQIPRSMLVAVLIANTALPFPECCPPGRSALGSPTGRKTLRYVGHFFA